MTGKKVRSTSSKAKKLKIKRETIKDLDTRGKGEKVKGGAINPRSRELCTA